MIPLGFSDTDLSKMGFDALRALLNHVIQMIQNKNSPNNWKFIKYTKRYHSIPQRYEATQKKKPGEQNEAFGM